MRNKGGREALRLRCGGKNYGEWIITVSNNNDDDSYLERKDELFPFRRSKVFLHDLDIFDIDSNGGRDFGPWMKYLATREDLATILEEIIDSVNTNLSGG